MQITPGKLLLGALGLASASGTALASYELSHPTFADPGISRWDKLGLVAGSMTVPAMGAAIFGATLGNALIGPGAAGQAVALAFAAGGAVGGVVGTLAAVIVE